MPNSSVDVDSWEESACYPRRTFYSLSDGPSMRNHRITMTDFRLCSNCHSRSQASFCHYTLKSDFRPDRANLCAPPLLFGRRPPQSNYPPCRVPEPASRSWVRYHTSKGWYFNVCSTKTGVLASSHPTYPTHLIRNTTAKL